MSKTKKDRSDDSPRSATMICPQCGAEFYVSCCEPWTWKIGKGNRLLYFCSYSCRKAKMQSLEAERAARFERGAAKRKQTLERLKAEKEAQTNDN